MKTVLLAGFLLCASVLSSNKVSAQANSSKASGTVLPAPVQNAYVRLEAQFQQQGLFITNQQWKREQNGYILRFKMVNSCTGCAEDCEVVFYLGSS
jgi:hypothetical protein